MRWVDVWALLQIKKTCQRWMREDHDTFIYLTLIVWCKSGENYDENQLICLKLIFLHMVLKLFTRLCTPISIPGFRIQKCKFFPFRAALVLYLYLNISICLFGWVNFWVPLTEQISREVREHEDGVSEQLTKIQGNWRKIHENKTLLKSLVLASARAFLLFDLNCWRCFRVHCSSQWKSAQYQPGTSGSARGQMPRFAVYASEVQSRSSKVSTRVHGAVSDHIWGKNSSFFTPLSNDPFFTVVIEVLIFKHLVFKGCI